MLDRHRNGNECLLWRTPSAGDGYHGGANARDSSGAFHLSAQVRWPTPTVPNGGRQPKGGMSMTGMTPDGKKRQVDLNFAVKNWPTPAARDGRGGATGFKNQPCLPNAVKPWPTPSVNDSKNDGAKCQSERHTPGLNTIVKNGATGQLNADWVEILMGYDIGHTDIDCDNPTPWPGWPAGQGEEQYNYEPLRVIQGQKNRAKRLKCLGNAVNPYQAVPIFAAIKEIEAQFLK
ncbi:MAG: hypothetical protein AB9917_13755 [Negativicutes bacterium]